jgi:hypothetical protein
LFGCALLSYSLPMNRFLPVLILIGASFCLGQETTADANANRAPADGPFVPAAALPGGIVVPLYAADSPFLKKERVHEAEKYNTSGKSSDGRLLNTLNIHNPTIELHLAPAENNTGTVIIVAPGGGHKILWVGPEGYDLVPLFRKQGVSTIVLRNRLRVDGYEPTVDAVNDAFQAIRIVRSRAAEWKIDPAKIGIIGFSAGAELSAPSALFYDEFAKENSAETDPLAKVSPRPDFVGLIYPGPTPFTKAPETAIPANVPPSFIVCAGSGDRVHALWADDYFRPMLKGSVPNLEMHIYGRGGHGGAVSPRGGIPFGTWHVRFEEWMRDLGFLEPAGSETKAAKEVAEYARKRKR